MLARARALTRALSTGARRAIFAPPLSLWLPWLTPPPPSIHATARKTIKVTFVKPDGSRQEVSAPIGDSMLEVAHANKIDIEGVWRGTAMHAGSVAKGARCAGGKGLRGGAHPSPPYLILARCGRGGGGRGIVRLRLPSPPLLRRHPLTLPAHPALPPTIAGACGGETACSTCHVYVSPTFYAKLPEVSEAEEDMLDLAAGLKDNSRLGCQIYAAENLDGMVVEMPKEVNNMKG